jgi:hypothetical protein
MSVLIRCQCQKKLSIPEAGLGKKIRCPACQAVFVATAESAITSEPTPALPKSAVKKADGPPPLPTRRRDDDDDEDVDERDDRADRPAKRRPRRNEAEPFPPISFKVAVKTKTDGLKKGNYNAVLDEEGILIKRGKKLGDVDIPRGSRAEYDGKANITVDIDGEPVKMQVVRFRTYQNRFAETLVDYLNREVRSVEIDEYEIPWYMFILVMLPWGVPIITLGGWLPIVIGAGISGANFAIISQESWRPGTRITIAAILTGLAYLSVILLLVLVIQAQLRRGF